MRWYCACLQVDRLGNLRVVLCDVLAEDMRCLRVRGDIRIRRRGRGRDDGLHIVSGSSTDEDLALGSCNQTPKTIGVVMDGAGTIASVNLSCVSEMTISLSTFYYYPGERSSESDEAEGEVERDEEVHLLQQLSADFSHLLVTEDVADVVLMVDGLPVRAHRAMLAARSECFRRMFLRVSWGRIRIGHGDRKLDAAADYRLQCRGFPLKRVFRNSPSADVGQRVEADWVSA